MIFKMVKAFCVAIAQVLVLSLLVAVIAGMNTAYAGSAPVGAIVQQVFTDSYRIEAGDTGPD